MQMKEAHRSKIAAESAHDRDLYDQYIENQHRKGKIERELWKNKYIRNGTTGRYGGNSDQLAYSLFLDKQIEERNARQLR